MSGGGVEKSVVVGQLQSRRPEERSEVGAGASQGALNSANHFAAGLHYQTPFDFVLRFGICHV